MKNILLSLVVATTLSSANFIADMSFAFGGDSDKIDADFVRDHKQEVVFDRKTGKVYSDSTPSGKMTYGKAVQYCESMSRLDFDDWRLTSKEELKAILEFGRRQVNVKHAFRNVQEGIYWTSTKDRHNEAWYVDFDLGRYYTARFEKTFYALCIRDSRVKERVEIEVSK